MSERYTRDTFPPPKRSRTRPRVKPWGGLRQPHPSWGPPVGRPFGGPPKRQCVAITKHGPNAGQRCCQPAMRGSKRCYGHGGSIDAARKGLYERTAKMQAKRLRRLQEAEDGQGD